MKTLLIAQTAHKTFLLHRSQQSPFSAWSTTEDGVITEKIAFIQEDGVFARDAFDAFFDTVVSIFSSDNFEDVLNDGKKTDVLVEVSFRTKTKWQIFPRKFTNILYENQTTWEKKFFNPSLKFFKQFGIQGLCTRPRTNSLCYHGNKNF